MFMQYRASLTHVETRSFQGFEFEFDACKALLSVRSRLRRSTEREHMHQSKFRVISPPAPAGGEIGPPELLAATFFVPNVGGTFQKTSSLLMQLGMTTNGLGQMYDPDSDVAPELDTILRGVYLGSSLAIYPSWSLNYFIDRD